MKTAKFTFTGISPLMLCADTLVDPLHELNLEKKKITGKRSKDKTEDDIRALYEIDWKAGLYYADDIGPFMPAQNIDACIRQAATMTRNGADIKRGFLTIDDRIPIKYKGPRKLDALAKDAQFRDIRSVVQQRARLMKCRPIFREWSLEFEAFYDPDIIDAALLERIVDTAGKYYGIGTYKPRFGRFSVKAEIENG